MSDIKEKISDYIRLHRDEMLSDLQGLVRTRSVRGEASEDYPFGKEPAAALEKILQICADSGLYTENVGNYIGTADFYPDREMFLGILCHVDTVPECDGWTYPVFDVTQRDGKLFGRGVIDDKGPAIAALYGVKALKALNLLPKKNVRFLFGTDEECGSGDLELYKKSHALPPCMITPDGAYPLINCEKGLIRAKISCKIGGRIKSLTAGTVINAVPDSASAVVENITEEDFAAAAARLRLPVKFTLEGERISARGVTAHASLPENGVNALTGLAALLNELTGDMAEISKLFPYGKNGGEGCGIACADEKSGALTAVLSVARLEGGLFEGFADIRVPAEKSSEAVMKSFEENAAAEAVTAEKIILFEPHYVPEDSRLVRSLLEVYRQVTGKEGKPCSLGGLTYVHGLPNSVAFGAEDISDNHNMHGADEFIEIDLLEMNAVMYACAILKLCGVENDV